MFGSSLQKDVPVRLGRGSTPNFDPPSRPSPERVHTEPRWSRARFGTGALGIIYDPQGVTIAMEMRFWCLFLRLHPIKSLEFSVIIGRGSEDEGAGQSQEGLLKSVRECTPVAGCREQAQSIWPLNVSQADAQL